MKRIALIHHTSDFGGGTKSLVDMAMMLCDNYEIIICVPNGKFLEVDIQNKNITIHEMECVPYLNFFSGSSPLVSKASLKSFISIFEMTRFSNEIDKINPDLVLFNTIVVSVGCLKLKNTVCALIDRETMTHPFHIKLYNRIIDKNIKGVAFLCQYEKEKFRIDNKTATVIIPDCVSEEDLKSNAELEEILPDDSFRVLFMGGSSGLKGADIALEAASKVDKKIIFIIAGRFDEGRFSKKNILKHLYNPSYCRHLSRLSKAYEMAMNRGNVLFVGNKNNIYPLIQKCDVVIFPSSEVHQPRPCIEAGYFKKPVIISDYKETEEYFRDGYNALTFRPNNSSDLARCIQYASEHGEEMSLMGEHNYEMSMKYHDYEKVRVDLLSFVECLIG